MVRATRIEPVPPDVNEVPLPRRAFGSTKKSVENQRLPPRPIVRDLPDRPSGAGLAPARRSWRRISAAAANAILSTVVP